MADRRDPTGPHALPKVHRVPAAPAPTQARADLISPENLGALLVELPRCRQETAALRGEIEEQGTKLAEQGKKIDQLLEDLAKRGTLIAAGRWLIGIALGALISGAGAFYAQVRSHETQLTRHQDAIVAVREDGDRRNRTAEHTQQELSGMRADLGAQRATLRQIEHSVGELRQDVRELRGRRR